MGNHVNRGEVQLYQISSLYERTGMFTASARFFQEGVSSSGLSGNRSVRSQRRVQIDLVTRLVLVSTATGQPCPELSYRQECSSKQPQADKQDER
jgi:hypothetical protein